MFNSIHATILINDHYLLITGTLINLYMNILGKVYVLQVGLFIWLIDWLIDGWS